MNKVEKFLIWYKNKIAKNPISVLIITIIALLAGVNTAIDFTSKAITVSRSTINILLNDNNEVEYKKLDKVRTGMNAEYIKELFGEPTIYRKHDYLFDYYERLYVMDQFFLYLVTNKDNSIIYYSVSTRKKDFNPDIPLNIDEKRLKLGQAKLNEISNYKPEFVVADMSSKFISYTETNFYGNPGLYKYYQFGYAPAGYTNMSDQQESDMLSMVEEVEPNVIERFRKTFVPNSFSVIDEYVEENVLDYIKQRMIGIDYFVARGYN